jgi:hypothetical protein
VRRAEYTDDPGLEKALRGVAQMVSFPTAPDVAPSVGAALRRGEALQRRRPILQRALAVTAVILVLLALTLTFSPAARRAAADLLGVLGIDIEVQEGRVPDLRELGSDLHLGARIERQEAAAVAGFEPRLPSVPGPDVPDAVYADTNTAAGGAKVTFVYGARKGFPALGESHVGLLVSEFQGSLDDGLIEKTVFEGARVEPVTVGELSGYWIGGVHEVLYLDPSGEAWTDTVRLADNTLVLEEGDEGITIRLESSLGKQASLEIARSLR